jgi:hypothetical protein
MAGLKRLFVFGALLAGLYGAYGCKDDNSANDSFTTEPTPNLCPTLILKRSIDDSYSYQRCEYKIEVAHIRCNEYRVCEGGLTISEEDTHRVLFSSDSINISLSLRDLAISINRSLMNLSALKGGVSHK